MKVLIAGKSVKPAVIAHLKAAAPDSIAVALDDEAVAREIVDADALIVSDPYYSAAIADAQSTAVKLRWLQLFTVGYDNVLRYGCKPGITVSNVGDAPAPSVALHAFTLMLSLQRAVPQMCALQANRNWDKTLTEKLIVPEGQTLLVVGFGAIGRETARLSRVLRMKVIGVSRTGRPDAAADEIHMPDALPGLLPRADVVVLALPLDATTRHMIGAPQFALMKPSAFLVNVARGGHVDQPALIDALKAGRIAGAALEVTDPEPLPPDDPLWTAPNCLISPHISGVPSPYGAKRQTERIAANIAFFLKGEPLAYVVKV